MSRSLKMIAVGVAGIVALAAARPPRRMPGWHFTMRMTVDSGGGRSTTFTMKYAGAGNRVRQEIEIQGQRIVSIMNGADSTITSVMADMGMAVRMRMPQLGGAVNLSTSGTSVLWTNLGSGEPMNGAPTVHRRLSIRSTVSQSRSGFTCSRADTTDLEAWTVADTSLAAVIRGMSSSMRGPLSGMGLPSSPMEGSTIPSDSGSAVKVVVRGPGAARNVTMTIEYLEYGTREVADEEFQPPSGIMVQDMRGMDVGAMADGAAQEMLDQQFWTRFDTTAAAGASRATCRRM
jgi:hypothetical protein